MGQARVPAVATTLQQLTQQRIFGGYCYCLLTVYFFHFCSRKTQENIKTHVFAMVLMGGYRFGHKQRGTAASHLKLCVS